MKPMLSATVEDINSLTYPLYASPKLDGIRAIVKDGKIYSRNMKLIPNKFIQKSLPYKYMDGWDGELIVGSPTAKDCFRVTTSGVMSEDGEPDFRFHVFDYIPKGDINFEARLMGMKMNMGYMKGRMFAERIKLVSQHGMRNPEDVEKFERYMLQKGYEGIMLRSPKGAYKFGRSTLKEQHLMKLKRFADSEAVVLELVEQMENTNEATRDELGRKKRSSHKAGKLGKGTLGSVTVRDVHSGVVFDIGTGFDDATRQAFWDKPKSLKGKIIKYKFFPSGSKDKPRFPVFLGIRED